MHPTQVGLWKRELQEQAASLFDVKRGSKPADPSASPERLYSRLADSRWSWIGSKKVWDLPVAARRPWVGIAISMDGRGRALDNIFVERLWRSVKHEDVYLKGYATLPELLLGLTE